MKDQKSQPASRWRVNRLAKQTGMDQQAYDRAMRFSGHYADRAGWQHGLQGLCLNLGVVCIIAAAVLLVAHFWPVMHKYTKFTVIEVSMIAALSAVWFLNLSSRAGKWSLFAAAVLMGVMLTVIDRVYTNGTSPHETYLLWALLILPWAMLSRFLPIWVIVAGASYAGVIWYGWQTHGLHMWQDPAWAVFSAMVALAFLVAWELIYRDKRYRGGYTWFLNVMVLVAVLSFAAPLVKFNLDFTPRTLFGISGEGYVILSLFVATVVAAVYFYYKVHRDMFNLTILLYGAIAVITVFCVRILFYFVNADELAMLLLGIIVVGQVSTATGWLIRTAKKAVI